jgi:hypothetical protein
VLWCYRVETCYETAGLKRIDDVAYRNYILDIQPCGGAFDAFSLGTCYCEEHLYDQKLR